MPLSKGEKAKLKAQLLARWRLIEVETGEKFPGLLKSLSQNDPVVALRGLSSQDTSGLARLFLLGRQDLSIERFIVDGTWATRLDQSIVEQCHRNLGA
jgi:hypothetical protein